MRMTNIEGLRESHDEGWMYVHVKTMENSELNHVTEIVQHRKQPGMEEGQLVINVEQSCQS